MSSMMRALVYEGPRQMNVRNVPVPSLGEREVLIRVERVGICGSELGGFLGHNSLRVPPLVMGHEFSGVVAEVGAGATKFRQGDRVTVNPLGTCGECEDCRADLVLQLPGHGAVRCVHLVSLWHLRRMGGSQNGCPGATLVDMTS